MVIYPEDDEKHQLISSFYDEKPLIFKPKEILPIDIEVICIKTGIRYPRELQTVKQQINYLHMKGINI